MRIGRFVLFGIAGTAMAITPLTGAFATCMMNVGVYAKPLTEQRARIGFVKEDADEAVCAGGGGGGPIDVGGDAGDDAGGGDFGGAQVGGNMGGGEDDTGSD